MDAVGNFFTGIWNAVVAIAPTIAHAVCDIVNSTTDSIKL